MGLFSIFKRRADAPSAAALASDPTDAVAKVRTGARRRLIGAVVLLGIGVIGFPILFETQPRPIPLDIPIEVPRKESAAPLVMPPARSASTPAAPPPAASAVHSIAEPPDDAGRRAANVPPAAARASAQANRDPPLRAVSKPPAALLAAPASAVPPRPAADARPATSTTDSMRAKALLDGKPPNAAQAGRFVVQVGAFADAEAARDTQSRAEKLGLKTYTQVASTTAGDRIRVRVGPFASRGDAEKALARARSAGLSAVLLTL